LGFGVVPAVPLVPFVFVVLSVELLDPVDAADPVVESFGVGSVGVTPAGRAGS